MYRRRQDIYSAPFQCPRSMTSSTSIIRLIRWTVLAYSMLAVSFCTGQPCKLPKEWRGRYYQSGIGETFVRETRITTKGSCVDSEGDYYLFHNRENRCYQCLNIIRRHRNLLQYRESFCGVANTLTNICSQIRPNTPFNMLVRDPGDAIQCLPFGAIDAAGYSFNYNDQTYGFCSRSTSYAAPCVNQTMVKLRFNHCVPLTTYNGRELYMECLANWTEDSETFIFARLRGFENAGSEEEEYRCFEYSRVQSATGDELYMAMSADATCRGLRSSTDGQFVMEFKRDTFGWPAPTCMFPDWLTGTTWRDGSGAWRYVIGASRETLQAYHVNKSSSQLQLHGVYRCAQIIDYYRADEEYAFLSFSTHACDSKFQCVKMRKRSPVAVEVHSGGSMEHWSRGRCTTDADYDDTQLIVADGDAIRRLVRCPYPGVYYTIGPAGGCVYRLDVGCHNDSVIYVESAAVCSGHTSSASFSRRFVALECRVTWYTGSTIHLIVRDQFNNQLNCFHFRDDAGVISLIKDDTCNLKTDKTFTRYSTFSILRRDGCPVGSIGGGSSHIPAFSQIDDHAHQSIDRHQSAHNTGLHRPSQSSTNWNNNYDDYYTNGAAGSLDHRHHSAAIGSNYADNYDDDDNDGASSGHYGNPGIAGGFTRGRHGRRQDGRDAAVYDDRRFYSPHRENGANSDHNYAEGDIRSQGFPDEDITSNSACSRRSELKTKLSLLTAADVIYGLSLVTVTLNTRKTGYSVPMPFY